MIKIVNIGMNHESAPVELRECLAKDQQTPRTALDIMRKSDYFKEGLFLSTCNRVEALYTTESPQEARSTVISMLSGLGSIPEKDLIPHLYSYEDSEAVRHVFMVASSLDSMMIGEPQILGQIKDAYRVATQMEKTSGVIINRLMHRAFHVAKRVKTETGISEAAVSISYAAVELARKIFHGLEGKKAFLIGAGEMAELAARHIMKNGVGSLSVANRSFDKAVKMAESFQGIPVFFEEIESELLEADIVITSTASTDYVISYDQVKSSRRKRRNRPLFFIDIAVPRDVEPRVNELENVYLYDIDDLKTVIEENTTQRKQEAIKAERIVQEEVIRFNNWLETLEVVPTIISIKNKVEGIRRAEISKSLSGMGELTPTQKRALETLTVSLVEKIINDPILMLKSKAGRSSRESYLDVARRLFNLDEK